MADKKISELTTLSSGDLNSTDDEMPVVDSSSGQTKKITPDALFDAVGDARYLQSVPAEYLTETEGDVRYLPELGSNANGEYVRFPDGTQICTFSVSTSSSSATTWTYPAAFDESPSVSFQPVSAGVRFATATSRTASVASLNVYDDGGTQRAQTVECIAIGRWS